jgi:hypothetical protein
MPEALLAWWRSLFACQQKNASSYFAAKEYAFCHEGFQQIHRLNASL